MFVLSIKAPPQKNADNPADPVREKTDQDPLAAYRNLDLSTAISQEKSLPPFRETLTDIFASPLESALEMSAGGPPPEMRPPSSEDLIRIKGNFHFQGSIIGERDAVAIINEQFVHVGDSLQGFTVASITENRVALVQGDASITLEMIPHD